MKLNPLLLTLLLALAGCSPEPEAPKAAAIKVDGDVAVLAEPDKATFLKPEMDGRVVVLRPSITVNDTGFAADGDWWDIKTSVPAAAVDRVEVRCGQRLLATLPVDRPAG